MRSFVKRLASYFYKVWSRFSVDFTRNTNATDVAIELQRSLNLVSNVWNGIATNTAGNWTPPGIVTESGNPVDVEIINSHTNHPAANYRLRVE